MLTIRRVSDTYQKKIKYLLKIVKIVLFLKNKHQMKSDNVINFFNVANKVIYIYLNIHSLQFYFIRIFEHVCQFHVYFLKTS